MKKLLIGAFIFLSMTSLANADVAYASPVPVSGGNSFTFYAAGPYLDISTYSVFGQYFVREVCIGGGGCGRGSSITVSYPAGTYLQKVVVHANDNKGNHTDALLQLYIDGVFINELDVKKAGSDLEYPIGRYVQNMQLKSINKNRGPGGDETAVTRIFSY